MTASRVPALLVLLAVSAVGRADDGPRPDRSYRPVVTDPASAPGTGALLCVDQAHHNFHRLDGLFGPFGDLLTADGYRLRALDTQLESGPPADCRVLVIANAQPSDAPWDQYPSPTPTAFTPGEVGAVAGWVREGGRLLLIADHMPFPGAAATLAAAFGCDFNDGFAVAAFTTEAEGRAAFTRPTMFSLADGTLREHPITSGPTPSTRVTEIATFAGQAFRCAGDASPLLVVPADFVSLMPDKPWQFTLQTRRIPVGGWLQGAAFEFGRGRVAIFGEAGMFTAQIAADGRRMGLNAPGAEQNARYVLNVVEWLAGP